MSANSTATTRNRLLALVWPVSDELTIWERTAAQAARIAGKAIRALFQAIYRYVGVGEAFLIEAGVDVDDLQRGSRRGDGDD